MPLWKIAAALMPLTLLAATPPAPVAYSDLATEFDRFEARTRDMPDDARILAFREDFERLRPGLYSANNSERLNRRILKSLKEFPALRPRYRSVVQRFGPSLAEAVRRFRHIFPDFTPPLPIVLAHELGVRDGGTDYLAGQRTMLFGADVIAKLHDDDSLQPFLEHELFHLEHARHFKDCDQFWCLLWQEGLATYAASVMTPGASDHQLLLDQPNGMRDQTDAHFAEAMCVVVAQFDEADEAAIAAAFTEGDRKPSALPRRFGYYVGYRVAVEAARQHSLSTLARLDNVRARSIVANSVKALAAESRSACRTMSATK